MSDSPPPVSETAAWTEQDCARWLKACDDVEHDLSTPHFNINRVATDVPWMIERMRKAIREVRRLRIENERLRGDNG